MAGSQDFEYGFKRWRNGRDAKQLESYHHYLLLSAYTAGRIDGEKTQFKPCPVMSRWQKFKQLKADLCARVVGWTR